MDIKQIISKGVMAFTPVYVKGIGDCTKVYTKQGGVYEVKKNVNNVRDNFCKYYCVDLKAIRDFYREILPTINLIPIPFNEHDVFVYVKVRKPLGRNDGAFGYVNIRYIEKVVECDGRVFIELKNKQRIECLTKLKTVKDHIKRSKIVREFYRIKQNIGTQKGYIDPVAREKFKFIVNTFLKFL